MQRATPARCRTEDGRAAIQTRSGILIASPLGRAILERVVAKSLLPIPTGLCLFKPGVAIPAGGDAFVILGHRKSGAAGLRTGVLNR